MGKKQNHPKMPRTYGKMLKRMVKTDKEKEEELEAIVNEDMAVNIFKGKNDA